MVEKWFKEYIDSGRGRFYDKHKEFIIYKGFKIVKDGDRYDILDVRFNDFYMEVSPWDFKVLNKYGFLKGCDIIMYMRDLRRADRHHERLEKLYKERDELKEKKSEMDQKEYNRDRRSLSKAMRENMDMMFFYESRARQVENKHNLDNE